MSRKSLPPKPAKPAAEAVVRDIRRATRRHYSAEDKIRMCWRACAACKASPPLSAGAVLNSIPYVVVMRCSSRKKSTNARKGGRICRRLE